MVHSPPLASPRLVHSLHLASPRLVHSPPLTSPRLVHSPPIVYLFIDITDRINMRDKCISLNPLSCSCCSGGVHTTHGHHAWCSVACKQSKYTKISKKKKKKINVFHIACLQVLSRGCGFHHGPVGGLLTAPPLLLPIPTTQAVEGGFLGEAHQLPVLPDPEREGRVPSPYKMTAVGSNPLVDDGHTPIHVEMKLVQRGLKPDQAIYHLTQLFLLCGRV